MALVHRAELRPSKVELLSAWLTGRSWYSGAAAPELEKVASYRFDDPAGEVGVETLLVRTGDGPLLQVPMTYRGAPLAGAERHLIGTLEHSVLGSRWVYDGCGDPVYAAALLAVMAGGGREASEFVDYDGELRERPNTTSVRGSGSPAAAVEAITEVTAVGEGDPTVVTTPVGELVVLRVLGAPAEHPATVTLTGTWDGQAAGRLLAYAKGLEI